MTWNTPYTGASSSKTGSTSEIPTESRVLKEDQWNLVKEISKLIKKTCLLPGGFPDSKKKENAELATMVEFLILKGNENKKRKIRSFEHPILDHQSWGQAA